MHFGSDAISVLTGRKIPAFGFLFAREWYDSECCGDCEAVIHEVGLFWDSWLFSTFDCEEGVGVAIKVGVSLIFWNVDGELYNLPLPMIVLFKLERVGGENDC